MCNLASQSIVSLSCMPPRFLFTDYNRLSSVGGETSMAEMIATLSDACEREFGFMATRLFRVFKNDEVQGEVTVFVLLMTCHPAPTVTIRPFTEFNRILHLQSWAVIIMNLWLTLWCRCTVQFLEIVKPLLKEAKYIPFKLQQTWPPKSTVMLLVLNPCITSD